MTNTLVPCLCLTCGLRNDFKDCFCPKGHDNWLEYRDVRHQNEFFEGALKITGLTAESFKKAFIEEPFHAIPVGTSFYRVISGGQTGIDRLSLELGKQWGFETGGTAPKGFRTENGPDYSLRDEFGLIESDSTGYDDRTLRNILDANLTIILGDGSSPGSKLTIQLCRRFQKHYFVNPTAGELQDLVRGLDVRTLNVAGNRASKLSPANRDKAVSLLSETFQHFKPK